MEALLEFRIESRARRAQIVCRLDPCRLDGESKCGRVGVAVEDAALER
jgi:hypothetical protein